MHLSSLKTKFILAVCVICVFCLFIASSISYFISYNIVKDETYQRTYESVSKYTNEFNTWFVDQGRVVTGIAEDIEINNDFNDEYLLNYLANKLKRQNSNVINDYYIGFSAKERPLISGSGWKAPLGYNCTNRDWYIETVKKNGLSYSTPYVDADTGNMVITISMPVKNEGQLVGVVAADVLLTNLMKLAQNSKTERADYAFLLDSKQNFLVNPAKSFQPTSEGLVKASNVLNGRYLPLIKQITSGNFSTVELIDYDGVARFFVLSTIKSTNWTFGMAITKTEYLKALNKLWIGYIISLIISLLVGIIIILVIVNGLLKPIVALKETVISYTNKNFQTHSPILSKDEVGELSASFNNMADTIQEYNQNLQQKVDERTKELREINESIMQSIDYAQRIQSAILPNIAENLHMSLESCFVIMEPRDVVGGDFCWSKKKGTDFYLAVADCTGHGVPGAMMTITVNAMLDRITDEASDLDPAKVLQKLNMFLKTALRQDNPNARTNDGVDIGVCLIKTEENKLFYAGAKITLFVVKDNEVIEVKGDRQSIGYKRSKTDYDFTRHDINLLPGITCYLTTDGLLDQNGQESKFGFGVKRFKQWILDNQYEPLATQKIIILDTLKKYQGQQSQRDDITVVGFKF